MRGVYSRMELKGISDRTAWGVFAERDGAPQGTVHVAPMFGRVHDLNDGCWCHPERDTEEYALVIHNVEH